MGSESIDALLHTVAETYGEDAITPYGTDSEEQHGTGFTLTGIKATFSVITRDGELPFGRYDIQVEGIPPGEYVYTSEVSLAEFMGLLKRFAGPEAQWP